MKGVPDWTLKELWVFDLTLRRGTVTAAADELGMTQSSASRILAGLEGKLGTALFERAGRSLVPTRAALEFHRVAEAVIAATQEEVGRDDGHPQVLRVAAPPSFAEGFLQDVICCFLAEHPSFTVRLEVRNSPAILEMGAERQIEVGFTDSVVGQQAVRTVPFRKSMLCCFVAKENRLSREAAIAADMLAGEPLVLLTRRHRVHRHVEAQFEKARLTPNCRVEVSSGFAALWQAKYLGGVTMMNPFPVRAYMPPGLVAVPFTPGIEYSAQFVLPVRPGPSGAVRRFMRAARTVAERQAGWSVAVP